MPLEFPRNQVYVDIHQFGRSFVVTIEDPSDPSPYRWLIVPTSAITFAELEAESYRAFIHATAQGEAMSRNEMIDQIGKALQS